MKIKRFKQLNEELPFDSYPGPPVIVKPGAWNNLLSPDDGYYDYDTPAGSQGYEFSFPYNQNKPHITRWSGDGRGKIGIKGGPQSGKIGGEFDNDFVPGGSLSRKLPTSAEKIPQQEVGRTPRKQKILNFLQYLNEI
ncbi:MAG: hypothetical protein ACOC3Z_02600 [Nanoarchaeota archaeon]